MGDESKAKLVAALWEKVESRMTIEACTKVFMTQGLDNSGAYMCLAAFQLVNEVLDEGGHVRRLNKSENQNLASILRNEDGPWVEQNKNSHQKWDYNNTWMRSVEKLGVGEKTLPTKSKASKTATSKMRNEEQYYLLSDQIVFEKFCERDVQTLDSGSAKRAKAVRSMNTRSMTAVDYEKMTPMCVKDGVLQYEQANGTEENSANCPIRKWETEAWSHSDSTLKQLEPYWMYDLHDKRKLKPTQQTAYKFQTGEMVGTPTQKPDVVLEITYKRQKHTTPKKIVVIVEIDGEDKTYQTATDSVKKHPVKLAVKVMQSTSVQAALQENSYHIRSNLYWYLKSKVDISLLGTTNVNIPDFQELMRRLQSQPERNIFELEKLTRVIHLVSHLYRAHVKVAFLIYMKEVHDIDMREIITDKKSPDVGDVGDAKRMIDHHFFINFQNLDMPTDLCFVKQMQPDVRQWLKERRMLQSRLKIKCFEDESSKWVPAPIMQTETTHSNMCDWKARVASGEVPLFPNESATSVPITYATIQRVNMQKLCEKVRVAAKTAYEKYKDSQCLRLRENKGVEITRREFPDRCYLTRSQQLDGNQFWNQDLKVDDTTKKSFKLRECHEKMDEAAVELNLGYEVPRIKRNYKEYPQDMKRCQFDQIDVRMYYLHKAMKSQECMESADGMWYTEDYVSFFKMLRSLKVEEPVSENELCTDAPPVKPDDKESVNLAMAKASSDYRFCFYEPMESTFADIGEINTCYYTKIQQSEDERVELVTLTFKNLVSIVKKRDKTQIQRRTIEAFLNIMTKFKILIPWNDSQKEEDAEDQKLSFAKIESFVGSGAYKCTLRWPYFEDGTYKDSGYTVVTILNSFIGFANGQEINTDVAMMTFFDTCLEKFKSKYLIQGAKRNIDPDLQYTWKEEDFNSPEHLQTKHHMPKQTYRQDLACHVFSVLSYFFDCRDDGACRYQWEESLLDYFGGSISTSTEESSFHKFQFMENPACDYKYYNEKWFQMCFFLEHNFRNAVSAIHYKLFDFANKEVAYFPDHCETQGLHTFARNVYERENNLLTTRASFVGLRNVSPGLSFRKCNRNKKQNAPLRDLILSQLDDELPHLDPILAEYVRKFRVPDSELFLRIIRCPNIIALRELAKQHLSSDPIKRLAPVLEYFDPAIQSEIEAMLKYVQTDDSVYVQHATPYTSRMPVVTQRGLLGWMRQAVGCNSLSSSLGMVDNVSPLQCKYDMFLNHASFHVLAGFFCKRVPTRHGTSESLKLILMQLKLMDMVLRCEHVEDCEQANDNVQLILEDSYLEGRAISVPFEINHVRCEAPCVFGTSRRGWPKRDMNKITFKSLGKKVALNTEDCNTQTKTLLESLSRESSVKKENQNTAPVYVEESKTYEERCYEMSDEELRLWMLLAYARPCPSNNSTVSITQENFMHKGQQKGDCESIELHYDKNFRNGKPALCHTIHTCHEHMFFERHESAQDSTLPEFPEYARAMIPDHIDRMLIYIPRACAHAMRRQFTNTQQMFKHEVDKVWYKWRPVFAGLRTWCWKRFLVKTIFLHAVGKIMTQTQTLLSTTHKIDSGDTYLQVWENKLQPVLTRKDDTSEDLSYKLQWFPFDIRQPEGPSASLLPVLTLHTYRTRTLNMSELTQIKVCSPARRQHTWLDFIKDNKNIEIAKSCRFLRLDKRQTQFRKLDIVSSSYDRDDDFFSHGEYVYFLHAKNEMYINIKGTVYAKFPTSHAIRTVVDTDSNRKQTSVCEVKNDALVERVFCTMFDTRRYDWSAKIKLQTPDDDEFMDLTTPANIKFSHSWRPVAEGSSNFAQWAFTELSEQSGRIRDIEVGYKPRFELNTMLQNWLTSETPTDTLVNPSLVQTEVQTMMEQVDRILNAPEN